MKKKKEKKESWSAIGRRKTATATVEIFSKGEKIFLVNGKPFNEYFPTFIQQKIVTAPLEILNLVDKFKILAKVKGGGILSQAEAVRHGLARVLVSFNPNFRKKLKKAGFLKRDPRVKERKKFGLKRARRAPQWQKR
jgi:small subunit ribosomal protein S9